MLTRAELSLNAHSEAMPADANDCERLRLRTLVPP